MARLQFGNTWWGEKWLDALTHIDYENRLPRGKTYARNGSVTAIKIAGNTVRASVQGRRRKPYAVTISVPKFSKKEQQAVLDTVAKDTLTLSNLLSRKLPTGLYGDLQKNNIQLFPRRWEDMDADCSCPDWAVPCKHIAAVIYLVANEIDKNPFLVFGLHDFDILEALETHGYSREQAENSHILSIDDIIAVGTTVQKAKKKTGKKARVKHVKELTSKDADILDEIDFSIIPDINDQILFLFSENPLFYAHGDFKKRVARVYKDVRKLHYRFSQHEGSLQLERDTEEYTEVSLVLTRSFSPERIHIATHDGKYSIDATDDTGKLIQYLARVPGAKLTSHADTVIALTMIYRFALRLAEQGAYIPQLVRTREDKYRIRWIPALVNEHVKRVFDQIVRITPHEIIGVTAENESKKGGRKRAKKNEEKQTSAIFPETREQALLITSLFLQYFIETAAAGLRDDHGDSVVNLFFKGDALKADTFETKELPQTINLWLSKFFITHKEIVPLLKVEADEDTFTVEVLAEYTKKNLTQPILLSDVFGSKEYQDTRADIMRDLTILSEQFPAIEKAIKTEGKEILEFDSREFVDVLFKALPAIKLLGIHILLPKELRELIKPRLTLSLKKKTKADSVKSYLSIDDMIFFDWRVALGDVFINAEEFRNLIENARGIVRLRDRYVYIDEKEAAKLLKGIEEGPRLSSHDLLKAVLTGEYDSAPIEISKETIALIRSLLDIKEIPLPKGIKATLRHYQERGYWWLYKNAQVGFGSLIADDMGLGKTLQVIAVAAKLKEEKILDLPGLVIVPTTLLTNWQREIEKFAPKLKTHIYHGQTRKFIIKNIDLMITTYGMARRESDKLSKEKWSFIVIDEAQNIKNAATAQTKAVKSIKSPIKIAMTGTPVENRLSEYWSIVDFLNCGYLGSLKTFIEDFAEPIELNRDKRALEKFRSVTSPFILRRVKTDKTIIKDLPDKNELDQFCTLTKEQASLYKTVVDTIMEQIESAKGIERRGLVFKLMTALKQVCNHPSHYLKKKSASAELSGKTALLLELLQTIYENDEKVLLFTQYTEMGNLLISMLDDQFKSEVLFLHGGVTRKKRDEMVDRFQTERQLNTMILSLKAGGTGLNLTAATNVIHVDLWWNPAVEQQATDRAYRIGQTKNVMVHRMITKDTFEEKINEMIREKKELADLTVAKGEKWIGELSNKELKKLFQMENSE